MFYEEGPSITVDYDPLAIQEDRIKDILNGHEPSIKWLKIVFTNWSKNPTFGLRIVKQKLPNYIGVCLSITLRNDLKLQLKMEKRLVKITEDTVTIETHFVLIPLEEIIKIEKNLSPVIYRNGTKHKRLVKIDEIEPSKKNLAKHQTFIQPTMELSTA